MLDLIIWNCVSDILSEVESPSTNISRFYSDKQIFKKDITHSDMSTSNIFSNRAKSFLTSSFFEIIVTDNLESSL